MASKSFTFAFLILFFTWNVSNAIDLNVNRIEIASISTNSSTETEYEFIEYAPKSKVASMYKRFAKGMKAAKRNEGRVLSKSKSKMNKKQKGTWWQRIFSSKH